MKKWLIFLFIIVVLVLAIGFYLHHKSTNVPPVPTVTVTKGDIVEKAQAIGYIKPQHLSTVKSSVNGTVMEWYHDIGDYVKKGEALAKIKPEPEPSTYAAAYEEVQEDLHKEKSAYDNLHRFDHALKTGLITKNYTDYINAEQNYNTIKEQRILAEQKLALLVKGSTKVATVTLSNTVTSPVDGFILSRYVDVGDPVISLSSAQASTAMFTIANMNDLMFEGSVDESDAAKLHLNMPATITVGSLSDEKISGDVNKISLQSEQENAKFGGPGVDANLPFNVSFEVQITNLKMPDNIQLRSGYSATADINVGTAKNVLILPERVLHFKDNKVYVLLPSEKEGAKPAEQTVTIGLSDGINAEIKQGLKLGDKVLDKPEVSEENQN